MTARVLVVGPVRRRLDTFAYRLPPLGTTVEGLTSDDGVGGPAVDYGRAAHAAGATVVVVGAVGVDEDGRVCDRRLAELGLESRLQRHAAERTSVCVVVHTDGEGSLTVVVPGATLNPTDPTVLDDITSEDVVLVVPGLSAGTVRGVARVVVDGGARLIVATQPDPEMSFEVLERADPFVVGERDAALLADVGLIPASLCVTFGRAGAVWDGMRIDGDDLGTPVMADGGTEAFGGTLAAGLAAGLDRRAALLDAVAASALTNW